MKVRQVKRARARFFSEMKKSRGKNYTLPLTSKMIVIEMCLEQAMEDPNRMVYDEYQVHFKRWERVKYKTLKTAFIKDTIREGFEEIRLRKDKAAKIYGKEIVE